MRKECAPEQVRNYVQYPEVYFQFIINFWIWWNISYIYEWQLLWVIAILLVKIFANIYIWPDDLTLVYNSVKWFSFFAYFWKIFHPNLSFPAFVDCCLVSSKDFCFAKGKAKIMKLYSRKNKGAGMVCTLYFQIEIYW